MNKKIKADLALLFVTFTWGISYIMTKNTVEDIAVFNFLALRFIIAFIVSYLIFFKRMKKPDLYSIKYGLGVGLILFLGYAVQTIGIQYTTSSKSAFITGLNVIFVPLISAFIWKTKIKNMTKIGVVVSIIGLVLMTVNDLTGFNIGDLYTLFSAVAFALHIIYVGRYTLKTDSIQFAIAQIGAVGLFSAVTSLVFEKPILFFSIESWFNILFLAVLCTSAAFITQNIAQRYTTSTHTALIYINEPVFAAIAGYLVAGEVLGVRGTIGGLLMLSGIIIAELNFKMKLGMKMFDYHVHSNYSSDCKTKMEDIISTAISKGISKIAITDHIDFDLGLENEFRYDERISEINHLRVKYYGQIEIINGVEIGIDISDIKRVESYLAKHPFEFKIMSIHMVNRLELFTEEIFNHYHPEDVLMMYLDEMFYAVNHFNDYDVIGHIDYLRRYNEEIKSFDINDYIEYYEVVLKAIIKNGKSLEINTSSLYYGDNEFYPNEEILKSYSRLGGKYISIGSDSHQSHTLGYEFSRAQMIVKKYGLEIFEL